MVLTQRAEHQIIRVSQRRHFSDEIKPMERNKCVKKGSSIYKLDPYIDGNGLLRVGGRLNQSATDESVKHPLLIPKDSILARLIIKWCHEKVAHSGRGITMNQIRSSGFWIKNCKAVKSFMSRCVICRRLRSHLQLQMMASLPRDKMCEEPSFTYCGVDLFGPFVVKEGLKELKRYGTLFTCLFSEAINIEAANSLSTDCFLMCLPRFIGRRGENVKGRNKICGGFSRTNQSLHRNEPSKNQPV